MDKGLNYRLSLKDFFNKTMLSAANNTKKLDGEMNTLQKSMSNVSKLAVGYFSFSALKNFGGQVVDSLRNYEMFSASLRTLMYGDGNAAKALQGQLVNLAAKTPFSLVDVQEGSKQLLAYGFNAGKVTQNMKMLGDVSSAVGAPLNDIIYLYGTLRTQGRAYTKDIMQFTGRGIPIIRELAKQFGVSESEVQKLVEAGKVGFPQIEQAFVNMTSKGGQFFGMMDEQSKTVGGRISNLGDAWEQLKVNIGKSQTGIINSTISWASSILSKFNDVVDGLNRMDEAFAGAKRETGKDLGYSWIEKFNNSLFMGSTNGLVNSLFTGGKGRMDMLQRSIQSMYVDPSKRSEMSAYQSQRLLATFASNYIGEFQKGMIPQLEYQRGLALIKYAQKEIEGNVKLFKTNPQATAGKEGLGESALMKSAPLTEVYGKPQAININVEKFGDITMQVENMTEGMREVRSIWSKEMLEMLNDANLIARR